MGSSGCAILCFVFFAFQGISKTAAGDCKCLSVTASGDCQYLFGGSVEVRLNESIAKVTALNSSLVNLHVEIVNVELYINASASCVSQLIIDRLQSIENARIYLSYAVNVALQANKSDCVVGWQNEFQTIYDAANAKINAAAQLYLSLVDSLATLKAQLSSNPYSHVLAQLNLCTALGSPRVDLIDRCFADTVYNYTDYVQSLKARIATIYDQAVLLKQGSKYGYLVASVDTSISIALYSLKGYAEYILTCAGVSVEVLYNHAVTEIGSINVKYRLDVSATDLKNDISRYINYLVQLRAYVNATVYSNTTLAALNDQISPLNATANVVVILQPQLAANISVYLAQGQALIDSATSELYVRLNSFLSSVDSLIASLLNLYDNYSVLIEAALANLTACVPKCIDARLNDIEQTKVCLHTVLANLELSSNVTNAQLAAVVVQINALNASLPVDVKALFGYINTWAIATSVEILSWLNLHISNDIRFEICNYLNTTYTNAVSNDLNAIVVQASIVKNLTSFYLNDTGIEHAIAAGLRPITDAINLILKVKPYHNVSAVLNTYNTLYNSILTSITNYLSGIYDSVTNVSNVDIRFSLANNCTKLEQDLNDCIQSVTTDLTVTNFVAPFICFEPILSNFNLLLNTTITDIQITVYDVSLQANSTETLIVGFIDTALVSGNENATTIAEAALTNASITVEAQVNATVTNITLLKQAEFDAIINQIVSIMTTLLYGNLSSLANVTAAVKQAVEPWEVAVNFSIANYPNFTQEISAEILLIQALINETLTNISTAVAPYLNISAEQGLQIQGELQAFINQLNLNLLNYSAANLTTRCSNYTSQPYDLSACLSIAFNELQTYLTTVVKPQLDAILQTSLNIITGINTNISNTVSAILNNTNAIAVTEGAELIVTYNVSSSQIIAKLMETISSYNITPILLCSKSIGVIADRIRQRMIESRNSGHYTISTTTYAIYDAVGSVMYLTHWYSSFPNETQLANQVVEAAREEVMALFPDATSDVVTISNISSSINTTLYYQVDLLTPSKLNISCGQYSASTDYYDLFACIKHQLYLFEVYYNQTLKDCVYLNVWANKVLQNDTVRFNDWIINVVVPRAALVVESLKPIGEKLITDNNGTVSGLIGYALHIIKDRYNEYKPQILSAAVTINATAANVTERNYTGIYSLEPNITLYLQPLNTIIGLIQNSSNTSLLTPSVLAAPQTFYNQTTAKFELYLANFSIQAQFAVNSTIVLLQKIELAYAGLSYDYLYTFCYNANSTYPLLDLIVCYNQHHYGFLVYLSNLLKSAQAFMTQLNNYNINYVSLITNYASNVLLPSYKNEVGLYAAKLYVAANMTVPYELQLLLTLAKQCVVGWFNPTFQCLIYL